MRKLAFSAVYRKENPNNLVYNLTLLVVRCGKFWRLWPMILEIGK